MALEDIFSEKETHIIFLLLLKFKP